MLYVTEEGGREWQWCSDFLGLWRFPRRCAAAVTSGSSRRSGRARCAPRAARASSDGEEQLCAACE